MTADTMAIPAEAAGGVRRRPRTARQRMMRRRPDEDLPEYSDEDLNEEDATQIPWKDDEPNGKIGAKKMRKLQEKAEKKERREVGI